MPPRPCLALAEVGERDACTCRDHHRQNHQEQHRVQGITAPGQCSGQRCPCRVRRGERRLRPGRRGGRHQRGGPRRSRLARRVRQHGQCPGRRRGCDGQVAGGLPGRRGRRRCVDSGARRRGQWRGRRVRRWLRGFAGWAGADAQSGIGLQAEHGVDAQVQVEDVAREACGAVKSRPGRPEHRRCLSRRYGRAGIDAGQRRPGKAQPGKAQPAKRSPPRHGTARRSLPATAPSGAAVRAARMSAGPCALNLLQREY